MVEQQRLARAEIAVRQALHHVAIRKRIESLSSRLLDTDKLIVARVGVERLRDKAGGRDERGRRRRVPVHMNLVPSRSAASIWLRVVWNGLRGGGTKKVTNFGSGFPVSMAARSNAEMVLPSPLKILLGSAVA